MNGSLFTSLPDLAGDGNASETWVSRLVNWVAEARSHRIICLVLGVWLLNGFDLAFTVLSHQQGLLHEENPLARHMLGYGTLPIILFKTGMVLIGSYPLLRYRTLRITEMAALLVLAAYVMLAIRWSTCVELYATAASHYYDLGRVTPLTAVPLP
jgi:hypothetical protein